MTSESTAMIIGGTGRVGSYASYFLARSPKLKKLIIVGRDEKKGITVLNNALVNSAINNGPQVDFVSADVTQADFWKTIQNTNPQVIANAAAPVSFYSWFDKQREKKKEVDLPLTPLIYLPSFMKLMEQVERSKSQPQVINLASPEACNPLATRRGFRYLFGAGTIDMTVQGIRWILSKRNQIPIEDVSATMIIHRVHRGNMYRALKAEKTPYYLRIRAKDKDVTNEYDLDKLISEAVNLTGTESLSCQNTTNDSMTAASLARNVLAVIGDTHEQIHVPGVGEMPGGAPARIGSKGAKLELPSEVSYDDALRMNQEGMKLEGIEGIENDGTVIFTDALIEHMKRFGLDYSKSMDIPQIIDKTQQNIRIIKQLIAE